jgi:hypothetical protein
MNAQPCPIRDLRMNKSFVLFLNSFLFLFIFSGTLIAQSVPTIQLQPASCGITNVVLNQQLKAENVQGATGYEFLVKSDLLGFSETILRPNKNLKLNQLTGTIFYNTDYTISVRAHVGNDIGTFGPFCQITTAAFPSIQLEATSCNIVNVALDQQLKAEKVIGATAYEFKVEDPEVGFSETVIRPNRNLKLTHLTSVALYDGIIFKIQVRAHVGNQVGNYGASCDVEMEPLPNIQLEATSCGITNVALNQQLKAEKFLGATGYEFKVVNPADGSSETILRPNRNLKLNQLSGTVLYNTTYDISVRAHLGPDIGDYDVVCQVTTEPHPLTQLEDDYCNVVGITESEFVFADKVISATSYEFELTEANTGTVFNITRNNRKFKFNQVAGTNDLTAYSIRVRTLVGTIWSPFGNVCNIVVNNTGIEYCGTTQSVDAYLELNPAAIEIRDNLLQQTIDYVSQTNNSSQLIPGCTESFTVPVVFHIVSNGFTPSPTTVAQVQSIIDRLNIEFNMPVSNGTDENTCIEFCLAKRAPDGTIINGLTQHLGTTMGDHTMTQADEVALAAATGYPPEDYLNIWVVDKIGPTTLGILGYSPWVLSGGTAPIDGVIIQANIFGDETNCVGCYGLLPSNNTGMVMVHEMGHYFGLYHTFHLQGACGGSPCNQTGDYICDTNPELNPVVGCPASNSSCSTNDPFNNHMDYTDDVCKSDFTADQGAWMRAGFTLYPRRQNLVSLCNLINTGLTASGGCLSSITATCLTVDPIQICTGAAPTNITALGNFVSWNVDFTHLSGTGTINSQNGTGNVSIVPPTFPDPGIWEITLTVTDATGQLPPTSATVYVSDCNPINDIASHWYFGTYASLDFTTGMAVPFASNGTLMPNGEILTQEASTAMSNPSNGALLFYTSGEDVWDATHTQTVNGTDGLNGSSNTEILIGGSLVSLGSASQGVVTVPNPANSNRYYIFPTSDRPDGSFDDNHGISSYEFDITLSANGDLVSTTAMHPANNYAITEPIAAIENCNGSEYWLVVHATNNSNTALNSPGPGPNLTVTGTTTSIPINNSILSYKVDASGLAGIPIVSDAGPYIVPDGTSSMTSIDWIATTKFSLNRSLCAMQDSELGDIFIYDFDASSGQLEFITSIDDNSIGIEFSPSGEFLYSISADSLKQYDLRDVLCKTPYLGVDLPATNFPIQYLELGPDNKIYLSHQFHSKLSVINFPDIEITSSNLNAFGFYYEGLSLGGIMRNRIGLPNTLHQPAPAPDDFEFCVENCSDLTVRSLGCNSSYAWSFDGNTTPDPGFDGKMETVTLSGSSPFTIYHWIGTTMVQHIITINNPPTPTIIPNGNVCPSPFPTTHSISNLPSMPAGATYDWSITSGTGTISGPNDFETVDVLWTGTGGTIMLTVTDVNDCTSSNTETITLFTPPTFTTSATPNCSTPCNGTVSVNITAGQTPFSYNWINNSTGLSEGITANISGLCAGDYTLTITDGNQCQTTAVVTVTGAVSPIQFVGVPTTTCNNNVPINFSATPVGGIFTGPGITDLGGGNAQFDPSTVGIGLATINYSVTVGLCNWSEDVMIDVLPAPTPNLGSDVTVCSGQSVNLFGCVIGLPGQFNYSWSPGIISTDCSINVNPTSTTTYTVTVTDNTSGCTTSSSMTATVTTMPPDVVIDDFIFCNLLPVNIATNNPVPGIDIFWSYTNNLGNQVVGGTPPPGSDPIDAGLLDLTFTGTRQYQVWRQDGLCMGNVTDFTITIPEFPAVTPQVSDITACSIPVTTPFFNITSLPSQNFFQYELYLDAALTILEDSGPGPNLTPISLAGVGSQPFWIVERTNDGCQSIPIQVFIHFTPGPDAPVVVGANLCEGYPQGVAAITVLSPTLNGGVYVVMDGNTQLASTSNNQIEIPGLAPGFTYTFQVHVEENGCISNQVPVDVTVTQSDGLFPEHVYPPNGFQDQMEITAVAHDENSGAVYITGWFENDIKFLDDDDNGIAHGQSIVGNERMFIARYSNCGELEWISGYAANGLQGMTLPYDITVAYDGFIYVTGQYQGDDVDFSGTISPGAVTAFNSAHQINTFVMQVDPGGGTNWAITSDSQGSHGSGITVDKRGQFVYIIGRVFATDLGFAPQNVPIDPGVTDEDYFAASFNAMDGQCNWIKLIGLTDIPSSLSAGGVTESIAVDEANGFVYVSGSYEGIIDIDPTFNAINSGGSGLEDIFLAKLEASTGNPVHNVGPPPINPPFDLRNIGDLTSNDLLGDMVVDGKGNAYLTGSFTNTTTIGPSTISATPGSEDIFTANYDRFGNAVWADAINSASSSTGNKGTGIGLDTLNDVYITGQFTSTTIESGIGGGPLPNLTPNTFGFLTKYLNDGSLVEWIRSPMLGGVANPAVATCSPVDLSTTNNGTSYYAGAFTDNLNFHTSLSPLGELTSFWANDGFLARASYRGVLHRNDEDEHNISSGKDDQSIGLPLVEEQGQFKLYPNPTTGQFTVELDKMEKGAYITITNVLGELITKKSINSLRTNIDLSNVGRGIYFVKITNGDHQEVKRLVKD